MSANATPIFCGNVVDVVACHSRVRSVLPKACDRAIDQARVFTAQGRVVEAILLQASNFEVFDDYVRAARQPPHLGGTIGLGKVDDAGALAAIGGVKVGSVLRAVRIVDKRRSPATCVVAGRTFDLDDVGTQVGEDLGCPRSGQNPGQFQHAQVLQWRVGQCSSPSSCSVLP